jgi:signal transduction histidine kinase
MFWKLHIGGWVAFFVLKVAGIYTKYRLDAPGGFIWFVVPFALAFTATAALRPFYRNLRVRLHSVWALFFYVIATCVVLANGISLVQGAIGQLLPEATPGMENITRVNHPQLALEWSLPILCWSLLYLGFHLLQDWQAESVRTERARMLARNAQLRLLRFQLNPHFLFNALNSIRGLILEDKQGAKRMVADLSRFLHFSLRQENLTNVAFHKELEALELYLSIEKRRYEEKIEVTFDVDPEVHQVAIPSFLLNPLVENAVKYGMSTSPMPLKIRVGATRLPDGLRVTVANTGRWVPTACDGDRTAPGTGTGLDNVRQRLTTAYPNKHHFEILTRENWVEVRLDLEEMRAP